MTNECGQFSCKLRGSKWCLTLFRGQGSEEFVFQSVRELTRFIEENMAEPKDDGSRAWG